MDMQARRPRSKGRAGQDRFQVYFHVSYSSLLSDVDGKCDRAAANPNENPPLCRYFLSGALVGQGGPQFNDLDQTISGQSARWPRPGSRHRAALTQMGHLLLGAIATNMAHGNEIDLKVLRETLNGLAHQMTGPQTAMNVLSISSDAVEALETIANHRRVLSGTDPGKAVDGRDV